MMAAVSAAEGGAEVILLERQARVGRKLAATGNGRCNITNLNASYEDYRGRDPEFSRYALKAFSSDDTLRYFRDIGLLTITEEGGRCYPYSDSANSVVDVLRFAMESAGIRQLCAAPVKSVKKRGRGFLIECTEETITAEKVIVACGGQAGAKLGGVKDGYAILESLGHTCTRLSPSLVPLKTGGGFTKTLKGVRAGCRIRVLRGGRETAVSSGELQFTEYGLSGPAIFDISRDACFYPETELCIDFLPVLDESELVRMTAKRNAAMSGIPSDELFTGLLQNRLGRMLVKECGLTGRKLGDIGGKELAAACHKAKNMSFSVTGDLGFDSAQVTCGGIAVKDFDSRTMESRKCRGLYACGEVLDIDGPCGGYNLQWAWSSGRIAGLSAGGQDAEDQ